MPYHNTARPSRSGRFVPALTALFLALFLFAFVSKYLQYYTFHINDFDAGIYSNLAWNIATGKGYFSDVLQVNHFSHHFSPIMYCIAPFYLLMDSVLVLFFFMALAYAAAFVILFHVFRDILDDLGDRRTLAVAISLGILFFSAPLNAALYAQFHPSTLALPFIALAILGLHGKTYWLVGLSVFFVLLTKENSCLAVIGLGLYAWLVLGERRAGIVLCLVALLYVPLVFAWIMPMFREGEWGHMSRVGIFTHIPRKIQYLVTLAGAFCFLPLFAPRALACALPLICLNLAVSRVAQFSVRSQYDDMACVFLAVAAAHGLRNLVGILEAGPGRKLAVALCVALVASGVYVDRRNVRFDRLIRLTKEARKDEFRQLRRELAPYIADKSVPVLASTDLGPYLSLRKEFRTILNEEEGSKNPGVVYGRAQLETMTPEHLGLASSVGDYGLWDGFYNSVREDGRFAVIHDSPVLFVFRRAVEP